ncbi:MAG: PEGA domain-containing protein [Planctomycetaceae bacterium]|nr:MAG: PEGA domain-containing protein [Planctomycetaceae bacterium]
MNKWIIIAVLACTSLVGCVEREMTITSEPPGMMVTVSGREVGRTPVTIPFKWYGTYEIILRQESYNTIVASADINMPWYEIPPIDLLSYMAPWTYKDSRYMHYRATKFVPPTTQETIERADKLKAMIATQPANP